MQQSFARDPHARLEKDEHAIVRIRIAQAVNARNTCDNDYVASFEQRPGRRHPQPIDVLVNDCVLFDVRIRSWDIGLGLVIIIVRNEIFDCVIRKQRPKFLVELSGQRLVVRDHQRWPLGFFDHTGDGKGLAAAGNAE